MPTPNGQSVQALDPSEKQPAVHEPSMEDILASIRRIIAADQTGAGMRSGLAVANRDAPAEFLTDTSEPQDHAVAPAVSATTHDLTGMAAAEQTWDEVHPNHSQAGTDTAEAVAVPSSKEPAVRGSQAHAGLETERPYGAGRHEGMFPRVPDWSTSDEGDEVAPPEVVGDDGDAPQLISDSVGATVSSSFQALANTVLMQDPETMERMARDALRPMLKAWLDENLPSMVERLVRAEIERVARGGRHRD